MVGMGGHNSQIEITDYFLLVFAILTPTLLTVLNKVDNAKITLKNILRFIAISLVSASIAYLFYGLHDFWLLYQDGNFGTGDNIPVTIIILLIGLSSTLVVGLLKNRI